MGNAQSSSNKPALALLVGLTETGKSHFISLMSEGHGDTVETRSPTHGTHATTVTAHGGRSVELVEIGSMVRTLAVLAKDVLERVAVIVWFIDSHDTHEDVHAGRNQLLELALSTDDLQPSRVRLAIVHNYGRPSVMRSSITVDRSTGRPEWSYSSLLSPLMHRPVSWRRLPHVANTTHLGKLFGGGSGVYLTQLSYMDSETPAFLLNWISK